MGGDGGAVWEGVTPKKRRCWILAESRVTKWLDTGLRTGGVRAGWRMRTSCQLVRRYLRTAWSHPRRHCVHRFCATWAIIPRREDAGSRDRFAGRGGSSADPDRSLRCPRVVGRIGSPLNLHRMLAPDLTRELRFISPDSEKGSSSRRTRAIWTSRLSGGVRELTPQSALLLDEIINVTDAISHREEPIIVSRELLNQWSPGSDPGSVDFPEEITSSQVYEEGSVKQILVNRYERDVGARMACLRHRGATCSACKTDLATLYGRVASRSHPRSSFSIAGGHGHRLSGRSNNRSAPGLSELSRRHSSSQSAVFHRGDTGIHLRESPKPSDAPRDR